MPYLWITLAFVLVLGIVIIRAVRFRLPPVERAEGQPPGVDGQRAAEHLAAAVRFQTVSFGEDSPVEHDAFMALHRALQEMFPRVHAVMERTTVNTYSLVYRWAGSRPDLEPVLFLAHQDVVPADPGTLHEWLQEPFSGAIDQGFIWGRGTLDCKNQMIGVLEAAETLLEHDFSPERTILFAFGHDEEIGGKNGAQQIVTWMQQQGIRAAAVLDEGGAILKSGFPGIDGCAAVIGTVEKGHIDVRMTVTGTPGHASTPPGHTAIGILARAITRIESNPMPAHVEKVLPMFRGLGGSLPFAYRLIFANQWLFGGILPREVRANLNIRLLPGDHIADVLKHLSKVIRDKRVRVELAGNSRNEASEESPAAGPVYDTLQAAVRRTYGRIPIAPYTMLGGSDARYYNVLSDFVYRFSPMVLTSEDLDRVHGLNERISVQDFARTTAFFTDLMRSWSREESLIKDGERTAESTAERGSV